MSANKLVLLVILTASAALAQYCEAIDPKEASALLGGPAVPLNLGTHGCSYSARERGVRLTLMMMDAGPNARKTFEDMKQAARRGGWLVGDENGMGFLGFSELMKRSAKTPSAKGEFVFLKGNRIIEIYVSDSGGKQDFAERKDTLDRLRPIAKRAASKI